MFAPTRRRLPSAFAIVLAVAAFGLPIPRADAVVTLSSVHQFGASDTAPGGSGAASGLTQGADGNFYGVTEYGGVTEPGATVGLGTIFRLTPDGTLTTLYKFSGPDGSHPSGPLLLATDGNFYGVADSGSSMVRYNEGTLFRMTPDGTVTVLHTFTEADQAAGTEPAGRARRGARWQPLRRDRVRRRDGWQFRRHDLQARARRHTDDDPRSHQCRGRLPAVRPVTGPRRQPLRHGGI